MTTGFSASGRASRFLLRLFFFSFFVAIHQVINLVHWARILPSARQASYYLAYFRRGFDYHTLRLPDMPDTARCRVSPDISGKYVHTSSSLSR
jgi:hypothetical protein